MELEQIVITVGPKRPYIHQTIDAIKTDLPVLLVMDSAEDYIPEYNITKILRADKEGATAFERALKNYCRCLMLAEGKNTLIMEDDVELHSNWQKDLERFVAYVETVYSKYILSIGEHGYSLAGNRRGPPQIDFGLVREPIQGLVELPTGKALHCLTNTNARYFPKTIATKEIVDGMLSAFSISQISYDLLLDRYLFDTKMKLFISQYPLSTHIGKISGLGNIAPVV